MAHIGIFSGTFDPVHNGHVAFALAALQAAQLDGVVFLPEPEPRGKERVAPLQHRRAMLQLAVQGRTGLSVLTVPGKQFSVTGTLPELERRFSGDELSLLIGSDVVPGMERGWPGLDALLARMRLVVGLRASSTEENLRRQLTAVAKQHPQAPLRVTFVPSPEAEAASSRIRSQQGEAGTLPMVGAYIARHNLYTQTI